MSGVTIKSLAKSFGTAQVIHGVDLEINAGEFCVFVGPSGCGKSTLLRMIAGLETATHGTIEISGRDVTKVDPAERGIAMVFQTYALYPHMTVAENMGFGLRMNGVSKSMIQEKVTRSAQILKLEPLLNRKPKALSGGQRQRVAIGRAIVRGPEVFLFDEPLSNLDAELRVEMRVELAKLHKQIGATMIYVTHDQIEAMTLADKIVVLRNGRIEQIGPPLELYSNPKNRFVAGFIGSPAMNFLNLKRVGSELQVPALQISLDLQLASDRQDFELGLRPEHIQIDPKGTGLVVELIERLGNANFVHLAAANGEKVTVTTPSNLDLTTGQTVSITFQNQSIFVFEGATGNRVL